MDAVRDEAVDQRVVLDAADAVADALGAEAGERLPHACRPACLAGVGGDAEPVVAGVAERRLVGVQRMPCLVAGDVQRDDHAARRCLVREPRHEHALLGVVVAQRAEDHARLDAGRGRRGHRRILDDGHDPRRLEPCGGMQERREAELGVRDVVGGELCEQILGDGPEGRLALHQRDHLHGPLEEVDQVVALARRDEVAPVLVERGLRAQGLDAAVARAAVEVEVELDLRAWRGQVGLHGARP